jgi:hypothetical protein
VEIPLRYTVFESFSTKMPPYRALYYTLGGPFPPMSVEFVDKNTYLAWQTHVGRVKAQRAEVPHLSINPRDYQPFLDAVRHLRAFWGGILVPEDIKRALYEVEDGLGLPVTQWQEAERYHSPAVVDAHHFGPFPEGFIPPAGGNQFPPGGNGGGGGNGPQGGNGGRGGNAVAI